MTEESSEHTSAEPEVGPAGPAEEAPAPQAPKPVLRGHEGIDVALVWISGFCIVVVGVLAYHSAINLPFHAEDRQLILENTDLHRLATFGSALDRGAPRPLTMFTLALNWLAGADNPIGFHVVNLVLHLVNGLLVFLLCRKLLPKGTPEAVSMVAGLLFVLHPLNTESVDYIVGRAGLLAATFSLLTLLLFVRATDAFDRVKATPLGLSVLSFVFAYASKETAAILPVLILAVDWILRGGKGFAKRLGLHAPYWAVLVLLVAARLAVRGGELGIHLPRWEVVTRLIRFTFVPRGLCVVHPITNSPTMVGALLGVVVLIIAAIFIWRRSVLGLAALWYMGALALETMVTSSEPETAERKAYLALAGMVLLAAWCLVRAPGKTAKTVLGVVAAALIVTAGAATYARNLAWRDEPTLWSDAAAKCPRLAEPPLQLGCIKLRSGEDWLRTVNELRRGNRTAEAETAVRAAATEFREAEQYLRRAVESAPENALAWMRLGVALRYQDRPEEAAAALLTALGRDFRNRECTLELAATYEALAAAANAHEDLLRAVEYYKRADRLAPLSPALLGRYGKLLASFGDYDTSEEILARAGAGDAASPFAGALTQVRAVAQRLRGMRAEAASRLRGNPSDAQGLRALARLYALQNQPLEAAYILERLLGAEPNDVDLWVTLGFVKARMGAAEGFLGEWQPPQTPPGTESAWFRLARACASGKGWDAALGYLEHAALSEKGTAMPLALLAEFAIEAKDWQRAERYFTEAATAYPDSPRPWLRLCDMAVARSDLAAAQGFLAEAEARNAAAADLAKRRERIKEKSDTRPQPATPATP